MSDIEEIVPNDYRVFNLVRFAIASECHKKGLKRDEIIEKVDPSMRKTPVFNKVLELANINLEENFGYNLVPLPVVATSLIAAAKTNQARKAAVTQMKKLKTGPPQFYALVSCFTPKMRAQTPKITRDPLGMAIVQAILLIIKLSGNLIEHSQLVSALNAVQLCRTDTSELSHKDLEAFLEQMKKDKFILKDRKSIMDAESVYSWGPRAFVEFLPSNMADSVHAIFTTDNKEEPEPKFKEKLIAIISQQ